MNNGLLQIIPKNHGCSKLLVVKLWLYKCNQYTKKSWLPQFYYNKIMVNFRKGPVENYTSIGYHSLEFFILFEKNKNKAPSLLLLSYIYKYVVVVFWLFAVNTC